jgi:NAD-dependent dihydropyrimidine dehydrogenase PreA subunit
MDIIYSASALGAFSGTLFTIGFLVVLGFGNLLLLFFTRNSRRRRKAGNYVMGCLSIVLLFFGVVTSIATYNTYQNGDTTALVQVEEKNVVKRNCKSITRVCTDYVVEATDDQKYYDFALAKDVWEKIEINACYDITYYPLKPLLGEYLQEGNEYADLYEAVTNIVLIQKANCP